MTESLDRMVHSPVSISERETLASNLRDEGQSLGYVPEPGPHLSKDRIWESEQAVSRRIAELVRCNEKLVARPFGLTPIVRAVQKEVHWSRISLVVPEMYAWDILDTLGYRVDKSNMRAVKVGTDASTL
ncbi:hypothetical protein [Paenarthrobacter nicotinovorans]|uniref:hypothetical protein n=1 Tax=Paenarthrobacter nicotinovorans TaxID=29320 RepID=UPI003D67A63A